MIEIERKYLVCSDAYQKEATSMTFIAQGFLSTEPERTVRVRVKGERGFLTIKGLSNESGTTREEWEYEIPKIEAEQLLNLCPMVLEKNRFELRVGKHCFEVDQFLGVNKGLVLAEIELESEDENFEKPNWLGREVTGDTRYYNSQLSISPFTEWN